MDLDEDMAIKLSETSPEFRKVFMCAVRCIQDMGKGEHTFESFLRVIDSLIMLHDIKDFLPLTEKND